MLERELRRAMRGTAIMSGLETFGNMLSVLEERPESWMLEHVTAMASWDLEDILTAFNATFSAIREASRRNPQQGSQEQLARDEMFERLYRRLWDTGTKMRTAVARFLESNYEVQGSIEFFRNLEEIGSFLRIADRAAAIAERIGLRDTTLTPEAAEQLSHILEGRSNTTPRPTYAPKSVPLVDASILLRKQ